MKPTGPFLEVVSGAAEPDAEVEQLLGAARAWAEPRAENRERVSASLRGVLSASSAVLVSRGAAPGSVPRDGAAHVVQGGAGDRAQPRALEAVREQAPRAAKTHWLIVGGALIGALGFWLGHGMGYGEGQRDAANARVAEALAAGSALAAGAHAAAAAPSVAPEASSVHSRSASSRWEAAPGLAGTPAAVPSSEAAPSPEAAASPEAVASPGAAASPRAPSADPSGHRPSTSMSPSALRRSLARGARARAATAPRARPAARAARDVAAVELAPGAMSFRQVLDQLRRAQQQLRDGRATASLLVLSELDRAAGEVLLEEREATRVLALCAVGQDAAARDVARRLQHDSPRSIYGMRLEASCVADAPIEPAAAPHAGTDGAERAGLKREGAKSDGAASDDGAARDGEQ